MDTNQTGAHAFGPTPTKVQIRIFWAEYLQKYKFASFSAEFLQKYKLAFLLLLDLDPAVHHLTRNNDF